MQSQPSVDVLIVGGGPVGMLTAYQLLKAGCSVHIVDKDSKKFEGPYGRANAIFARSAELLDQLGLANEIVQQSHFVRESYTYDSRGERVVPGRVWNFVENIDDTKYDFGLMLRQQSIERCFQDHLKALGGKLYDSTECLAFNHTETPDENGNYVTATMKQVATGAQYMVKSKFLVGADGGQSFVRKYLNIAFEGERTEDKWIRIDGQIKKTNMPTPRAYASIESPTHGNVLWAPLDRGVTRIGYVFTPEKDAHYGGKVTEEIAVKEAIAAVKPFDIEYERIDWWTLYIIGQRVAATYQPHKRIILAGDACHTHSSGAAQGLNTGIHDASNLGWKLILVIKSLAKDSLLDTYSTERRAAALRLIEFDKKISTLMASKWPKDMERPSNKDINQVLADLFDDAVGYNTGLGIRYEENLVNVQLKSRPSCCSLKPGSRIPDLELLKPGSLETIRLHKATPNQANIYLLTLLGDPRITRPELPPMFGAIDKLTSKFSKGLLQPITIAALADPRLAVDEALGLLPCGKVYYDRRSEAHRRFDVDLRYGAMLVLRPDGYLGFAAQMGPASVYAVETYLKGFLIEKGIQSRL